MRERIIAAATKALTGEIFTGSNHGEIGVHTVGLFTYKGYPRNANFKGEQGFYTSHERFVGRMEAALIALLAGQINKLHYMDMELDSDDINTFSIDGSKLVGKGIPKCK